MAKTNTFDYKGLKLPILDLQGKDYLPVAARIAMFRHDNPSGAIATELVQVQETWAIAKGTVLVYNDTTKQYQVLATGFAKVTEQEFGAFIEKAETAAVGRALIAAGYGTLQCGEELAEETHLADAPVERPYAKKQSKAGTKNTSNADAAQPGAVQAAKVGTPAAASQPGNTEGSGTPGVSSIPATQSRQEVNALLSSLSRSIIAKRIMNKNDIQGYMSTKYGTSDKEKLDDTQAQALMAHLNRLNSGTETLTPSNGAAH